jgi:hypothetical protein
MERSLPLTQVIAWQRQLSDLREQFALRNLDRSLLIDLSEKLDGNTEPADVISSMRKLLESNCRLLLQSVNNTKNYDRLSEVIEQIRLYSSNLPDETNTHWKQFFTYAVFLKYFGNIAVHSDVNVDHMDQATVIPAIIKLTHLFLQLLIPIQTQPPKEQKVVFSVWIGNLPSEYNNVILAKLLSLDPGQVAVKKVPGV